MVGCEPSDLIEAPKGGTKLPAPRRPPPKPTSAGCFQGTGAGGRAMAAKATVKRTLSSAHPKLARQWHPTKNGALRPRDVTSGSGQKVWWRCSAGHEWQAVVASRTRPKGCGCPYCSGRKVLPETSLKALHPELAQQFHATKNRPLTSEQTHPGSKKKLWWRCPVDARHVWQALVNNRVRGQHGCPFCSGRRATTATSLQRLHPAIARQWHPTLNGDLRPRDVTAHSSRKKVWWRCPVNQEHAWQARTSDRVKGRGCPFCAGQQVTTETSLAALEPQLARQWDRDKNGALRPQDVRPGSGKKVWWRCRKGHRWQAVILSRTRGNGCPVCAGQQVADDTSLQALHPELAEQWHPTKNRPLKPNQVRPGSNRAVYWRCDEGHVWKATIHSRASGQHGCPYHSGRYVTKETSLQAVNPELARQWHRTKNADLRPRDVRPGSNKKVWWRCPRNREHEWCATVGHRSQGQGCPYCAHRRVSKETSLLAVHPGLASEWHPTKNGELEPGHVLAGSRKRVWWRCQHHPEHEWQTTVTARSGQGRGCPHCAHEKRRQPRRRRKRGGVPIFVR